MCRLLKPFARTRMGLTIIDLVQDDPVVRWYGRRAIILIPNETKHQTNKQNFRGFNFQVPHTGSD
jgi:hypothetical protein